MPRNPMQDIVPKGTRSIKNVPLSESRMRAPRKTDAAKEKALRKDIETKIEAEKELEEDIQTETAQIEELEEIRNQKEALRKAKEEFEGSRTSKSRYRYGFPKRPSKSLVYKFGGSAIALCLLVGLVIAISTLFHSATVTVTPHRTSLTVNEDLSAKKSGASGDLVFQPISIDQTASVTVRATGQKQVSTKATGVITIYNNYNATAQRLIKNTRFTTPEGLVFRITDSVTVPGKKGTVPGSVDADVVADEAGADYNVGLKDFTIPGFKGDPRYTTFYARSKTPLAGGFVGIQKIVSDTDRAKAKTDIETKLHDDLVNQLTQKRTSDIVIYDKAYTIEYKSLPDETVSSDQVVIKESGTLSAAAFDKKQLSSALAKDLVTGYKGEAIVVSNIDSLVFTTKDTNLGTGDTLAFHLAGPATFEWLYDETALKTALKGQTRANTPVVLQKFPMIEKIDISITPFWSRSFPTTVNKITIKKNS